MRHESYTDGLRVLFFSRKYNCMHGSEPMGLLGQVLRNDPQLNRARSNPHPRFRVATKQIELRIFAFLGGMQMLKALMESGQIVWADHMEKADGPFRCPICDDSLILKKGRIRIHHFAHERNSECEGAIETLAHRKAKASIYDALKRCEDVTYCDIEVTLPSKQRADILFEVNQQKVAIELQRSQLSLDQIKSRTEKYSQQHIAILWVSLKCKEANVEFRPSEWERWIHALYFGNIFYYAPAYGDAVDAGSFNAVTRWIEESYNYDGDPVGGYETTLKKTKTFSSSGLHHLITGFSARWRKGGRFGPYSLPSALLWQPR